MSKAPKLPIQTNKSDKIIVDQKLKEKVNGLYILLIAAYFLAMTLLSWSKPISCIILDLNKCNFQNK